MRSKISPLIVIVGETASGKSDLAMKIARKLDGEIISADSWAIYKGMNIGTAKPSPKDQEEIRHHLIDLVEPNENYSAAQFKKDALQAITEIQGRGKVPIMVGGTGLYVDGVIFDFGFLKTGNRRQREHYNSMDATELAALIEARGYDLISIDVHNKRRLIRVLESEGQQPTRKDLRINTIVLGLNIGRTKLRKNVEQRVEQMFRRGLKKEVMEIAERYGWECEGMQGIGYKEFHAWHRGEISMTKVKALIAQNTLSKLAKHQRTWFKRNPHIQWFATGEDAIKKATSFIDGLKI